MEKLKDIKGLIEITDYSLYIFIFLCLLIIGTLIYLIKKYLNRKKSRNLVKEAKIMLNNLDFSNAKQCSYSFSKYISYITNDDEVNSLNNILEKYKYKKDVSIFSEEDEKLIKDFLGKYNV